MEYSDTDLKLLGGSLPDEYDKNQTVSVTSEPVQWHSNSPEKTVDDKPKSDTDDYMAGATG